MFRRNLRELLKQLGMTEDLNDETIDALAKQMLSILEEGLAQNAIVLKTGCILHQFILTNTGEVREGLEEQLRAGNLNQAPPPFKIAIGRLCLYFQEDKTCQIINENCTFATNFGACEVARGSIDRDLGQYT